VISRFCAYDPSGFQPHGDSLLTRLAPVTVFDDDSRIVQLAIAKA